MEQFELNAEMRDDVGKGASRRLRRAGKVPGIVYGTKKDVTLITLAENELAHQLEHEAFFSHILVLNIEKKSEKVVLKDLQRHPYRSALLHVDFQRIDEKQKLTMRVPIHFENEDKCVGVKQGGGVISHIMTELEITCLPKDLPEYIAIDMTDVKLGETIHLGDISTPEGVDIYALLHGGDPSRSVASVHVPRAEEVDEVTEEEEELAADVPVVSDEEPGEPKEEEES